MYGTHTSPHITANWCARLAFFFADAAWLVALTVYAFAGMALVPLHGDEPEHLSSSRDFATYFLDGQPGSLAVTPPYLPDSDAYVRIQTGTLTDYLMGLGWYLGGYDVSDLPGTWAWWTDCEGNIALGTVPSEPILMIGRAVSTWLFAISIMALFGIARRVGGHWLAYLSSGLYTANPILLVNARRAMTEGAMLCFGLLTLLIALMIVRRLSKGRRVSWGYWIGLGLCSGLAVAAKFSSSLFVAAAVMWMIASAGGGAWREKTRRAVTGLIVSGGIGALVYLILTPALWRDPAACFIDQIRFHKAVLDGIALDTPGGPTTLPERIGRLATTPFIASPMYFESPPWADYPVITQQIQRYQQSWLHGIEPGPVLGGVVTLLMLVGLVSLFLPGSMRGLPAQIAVGIGIWYAATATSTLLNLLPWDRYDLLIIPAADVLGGLGLRQIARLIPYARQNHKGFAGIRSPTH